MDLDQRWVKKSDRDQEVIPLQAGLAVGEELFIDRLSVIDTGLKLSRLPVSLPSSFQVLLNGQTAGARARNCCTSPPPCCSLTHSQMREEPFVSLVSDLDSSTAQSDCC